MRINLRSKRWRLLIRCRRGRCRPGSAGIAALATALARFGPDGLQQLPIFPEFHHALAAMFGALQNMPDAGENQLVGQVCVGAGTEDVVGAQADPRRFVSIGEFHPERAVASRPRECQHRPGGERTSSTSHSFQRLIREIPPRQGVSANGSKRARYCFHSSGVPTTWPAAGPCRIRVLRPAHRCSQPWPA